MELTALSRVELDVTNPAAVRDAVAGNDVVLNAAAWTDVDAAETREDEATAVNGTAVGHLAAACAESGAILLHISTDYVFGGAAASAGTASTPIAEATQVAPLNAYGRGKLVGEKAALAGGGYVVRTAWLYDWPSGPNFVTTMLRLAGERDTIDVVDDQRGQPTWARALAAGLFELAGAAGDGRAKPGVYHGTAAGETTWYGLARAVFTLRGLDPDRIRPTTSQRFPRPAARPAYSVLDRSAWAAAGLTPLADWHDMLTRALAGGDPA